LSKRIPVTRRRFAAFVTEDRGRVLVRQRPAGVVNGHLWEFPNVEIGRRDGDLEAAASEALGFSARALEPLLIIKHSITRYRMTLEVFRVRGEGVLGDWVGVKPLKRLRNHHKTVSTQLKLGVNGRERRTTQPEAGVNEKGGGRWMRRGELARLAFCSAHKKIIERL
jgi:adenine-specific DNA glycosylase